MLFGSKLASRVHSSVGTILDNLHTGIPAPRLQMAPPYPNNLNTNHQSVPPTDNIQSGLAIPLHAVGSEHVGNKLRLVVQ